MSRRILPLLACLPLLASCVYFNTFYNAKKAFRHAEELRREQEREELAGTATGARRNTRAANSPHEHYERAIVKASKVLEEHRDSDLVDDAMFLIGQAFYWQGDYLNSARTFSDLEDNFPDSEYALEARYWRGRAHEAQGAFADARRIYRGLFRQGGAKVGSLAGHRLGEMAAFARDYIAAIEEYRLTLEAFPQAANRALLWLRTGEMLLALEDAKRYGEALQSFERVLDEKPSLEEEYRARLNRGRVFFLQGDGERALKTYGELIADGRFRRFEGDTRLLIGEYYQNTLQLERAIVEYERVRDDFPQTASSAMALYRTGLLYLQTRGDIERAREYFKEVPQEKRDSEAVQLSRDRLKDLDERDRLLLQIARADSAAAPQEADSAGSGVGVSRTQDVQEALFAVAEIYRAQLGQADSASYYLQEALRRFPDDRETPRTLYTLAWIARELKGDEDGARVYIDRLLDEYPYSEQANEARRVVGAETVKTAEAQAQERYGAIEKIWLENPGDVAQYVGLLDSLAAAFPNTRTAERALYTGARAYENAAGDSAEAERRYAELAAAYPTSLFAQLIEERRQAQQKGVWEKMERDLRAIGEDLKAGEALKAIAVEPDSADSNSLALRHFGYGVRAHRHGNLKEAREEYEWSLEQVVRNPRALYYLGDIMLPQEPHDAKEYYLEALRYRGGMLGPLFGLVRAYTALGMADSASFYLREAVKRDRSSLQAEELRNAYPDELTDAEPRDLELAVLEEIELPADEEPLEMDARELKLEALPLVRKSVKPAYPDEAAGDTARVFLDVLVAADGGPELVEVYRGAEPFAPAAVEAAQKYTFFPAEAAGGVKVPVWVEVQFVFAPPSGQRARREPPMSKAKEEASGVLPQTAGAPLLAPPIEAVEDAVNAEGPQ